MKASPDTSNGLLPAGWVVGFTGHRLLHNPDKIRQTLRTLLDSLRAEIPGQLVGYSSAAIGADAIFAEESLSSGLPWMALLSHPEQDFKTDFSPADWAKTSALLERAASVRSLAGPNEKDRDLGYLECGMLIVEEADLIIAVWDGKPSRGIGGTADVVAHTRNLNKPLIVIDSDSMSIRRERFSLDAFSDSEMNYLNRLAGREQPALGQPIEPRERIEHFFRIVDTNAARIAPQFRRWVAASVVMNALAAILVTAAITFQITSFILDAIAAALMIVALLAVALIKRKKAHQKWIACRVASEMCRSVLATWRLRDLHEPVWFDQLAGFHRLAKTIRLLKLTDRTEPIKNVDEWREKYLAQRVDEQIHYFRRRRRYFAFALSTLTLGFWVFSAAGIVRGLLTMSALGVGPVIRVAPSNVLLWEIFHSFLPISLPLAAGCALSLISIFDLNRQLARSRVMEALLNRARNRIEKCDSVPSLRRAVENAENTLASEVFEWFTLSRYPRFN